MDGSIPLQPLSRNGIQVEGGDVIPSGQGDRISPHAAAQIEHSPGEPGRLVASHRFRSRLFEPLAVKPHRVGTGEFFLAPPTTVDQGERCTDQRIGPFFPELPLRGQFIPSRKLFDFGHQIGSGLELAQFLPGGETGMCRFGRDHASILASQSPRGNGPSLPGGARLLSSPPHLQPRSRPAAPQSISLWP